MTKVYLYYLNPILKAHNSLPSFNCRSPENPQSVVTIETIVKTTIKLNCPWVK